MRENRNGRVVSVAYGHIPAIAIDPVEKKPLYHFMPGSKTLSFGASGCNLSCAFCQNWQLSQIHEEGEYLNPDDAVRYALNHAIPSISFTYSEPLVWQDYMMEIAAAAKEHGIRTIMVSNGSFSDKALERIIPLIDAYNIDLKGDEDFYRDICKGEMEPVVNAIRKIAENGKHIEITTMLIENIHTGKMIREIGRILKEESISVWHLTRFFPQYKMNYLPPTSELFLSDMISIARDSGIPYIYPGNSVLKAQTICPGCGRVIRTHPGEIIRGGECPYCGKRIYGVWESDNGSGIL